MGQNILTLVDVTCSIHCQWSSRISKTPVSRMIQDAVRRALIELPKCVWMFGMSVSMTLANSARDVQKDVPSFSPPESQQRATTRTRIQGTNRAGAHAGSNNLQQARRLELKEPSKARQRSRRSLCVRHKSSLGSDQMSAVIVILVYTFARVETFLVLETWKSVKEVVTEQS